MGCLPIAMSQCVCHKPRDIMRCVRHTPPRDVALCSSHTALYHAVCPSHNTSCTPRDIAQCPKLHAKDDHGMYSSRSMGCPPREARGVCPSQCRNVSVTDRAISRGVSVTQRVTDITRPMWCMPSLYFLQHFTSASPSLSYNLINKPASYYSIMGVSWTVGNGTVS